LAPTAVVTAEVCLADPSAWHWSRVPAAHAALQAELDAGTVATCAIIDAELIVSARGPADADALAAERRALRWLPTPDDVWDTVLATQRALVNSARHRMVKIPDLVIAAVAQRHGAYRPALRLRLRRHCRDHRATRPLAGATGLAQLGNASGGAFTLLRTAMTASQSSHPVDIGPRSYFDRVRMKRFGVALITILDQVRRAAAPDVDIDVA